MALFSIYTGMLYNEFFSIPLTLFGKGRWVCATDPNLSDRVAITFNPELCPSAAGGLVMGRGSGPYPMGVDPTWHGTRTELPYLNSLKMKMSVILGALSFALFCPPGPCLCLSVRFQILAVPTVQHGLIA